MREQITLSTILIELCSISFYLNMCYICCSWTDAYIVLYICLNMYWYIVHKFI